MQTTWVGAPYSIVGSGTEPSAIAWQGGIAVAEVPAPSLGGGGGTRGHVAMRRRRPLHYWEVTTLKYTSRRKIEEAVEEELAYAEGTIPKSIDVFWERIDHLKQIEKRLRAIDALQAAADRIDEAIARMEESAAMDDEESEVRELMEFL